MEEGLEQAEEVFEGRNGMTALVEEEVKEAKDAAADASVERELACLSRRGIRLPPFSLLLGLMAIMGALWCTIICLSIGLIIWLLDATMC